MIKSSKNNTYQHLTSQKAGWEFLNFNARLLRRGETITGDTIENEFIFILLAGDFFRLYIEGKLEDAKWS